MPAARLHVCRHRHWETLSSRFVYRSRELRQSSKFQTPYSKQILASNPYLCAHLTCCSQNGACIPVCLLACWPSNGAPRLSPRNRNKPRRPPANVNFSTWPLLESAIISSTVVTGSLSSTSSTVTSS